MSNEDLIKISEIKSKVIRDIAADYDAKKDNSKGISKEEDKDSLARLIFTSGLESMKEK